MQEAYDLSKTRAQVPPESLLEHHCASLTSTEESSLETLRGALAELLRTVGRAFQDQPDEALGYVLRAAELLRIEPKSVISGPDPTDDPSVVPRTPRGGLAPWVVRKVSTYIETHLDSSIRTPDLASIAQQSVYHFCRAFRQSFDEPPHTYVMRRRIERAQGLILQTDLPLARIAIDCGLADQAHLNKAFRRLVGQSPGSWRRARTVAPDKKSSHVQRDKVIAGRSGVMPEDSVTARAQRFPDEARE